MAALGDLFGARWILRQLYFQCNRSRAERLLSLERMDPGRQQRFGGGVHDRTPGDESEPGFFAPLRSGDAAPGGRGITGVWVSLAGGHSRSRTDVIGSDHLRRPYFRADALSRFGPARIH